MKYLYYTTTYNLFWFTTDLLRAFSNTHNKPSFSPFSWMWCEHQRVHTPSVVHQQLVLINPGDLSLLAGGSQRVSLCLHTLISLVSVQNVLRMASSESACPTVPSFIFLSICHKSQSFCWNQWEKLEDQSQPSPEQTDWANGPAAFSSRQSISRVRECSQSSHDGNTKAY